MANQVNQVKRQTRSALKTDAQSLASPPPLIVNIFQSNFKPIIIKYNVQKAKFK